MPECVTFFVAGKAVPWRAPQVTRNGKHTFSPAHVKRWQKTVKTAAALAMVGRPKLSGPVSLRMVFVAKATKARPRELFWAARPDWVNLTKAAEDAIQGAIFEDDNQVVSARVDKIRGAEPGVQITVREMAP